MATRTPVLDGWLGVEAVRDARERTRDLVRHTPVLTSRSLSDECGGTVLLKAENLQRTGSFKLRGALAKVDRIAATRGGDGAAVVAGSAGNHAQSLAYAARARGLECEVFMPAEASLAKVAAVRGFGGTVRLGGDSVDGCVARARERAAETGAVFVHPFDDPEIVAGQATLGLELLDDVEQLATVVVPVGGGGLIAGIASAARALNPKIRIYGVESRTYPSMHQRLAGEPVKVGGDTIAEGIAVKDVGDIAFGIVKKEVEDVVVVAEETIERAVVALIEIEKTVAEGAGAAALAALLEHPQRFAGKRVGIPVSGGNIDSRVLASVLMRGLVRDARLVRLRVTMPDVSGSLAKVAQLIADAGGNIVEVQHQRIFGTASVRSPEVEFLIETRDSEHTRTLVRSLEEKGIRVSVS
jgi:threonine dehydratase